MADEEKCPRLPLSSTNTAVKVKLSSHEKETATDKKNGRKNTGLKLATDRVKSMGSFTPCSSPSEGSMFASVKEPDWKKIEIEVSHAFDANKETD